jgi:hypothetical protein
MSPDRKCVNVVVAGKPVYVEIIVDVQALAEYLAKRAVESKRGIAKECYGAIICNVVRS